MPAEWERHAATWLTWPHNPETWPGISIHSIQDVWLQMVEHLSPGEVVHLNVLDEAMATQVREQLQARGVRQDNIFFHHFPSNDAWVRDHGPIFVFQKSSQLVLLDWEYNAWGKKYPPYDLDNAIPKQVADFLQTERICPGLVLEGGSIEVNGLGTLLTTESCLLNPNRNPSFSKQEIEQALQHYLGVSNILWLGDGIVGDDTDGHIDDLTRFVNPMTVVTVVEEDPQDENYQALQENLKQLEQSTDEQGKPLQVIKLPMPAPILCELGRLPASYANFYIGNQVVLTPTFQDPKDEEVLEKLQKLFPDRRVVGLDCRELVKGLGALHCVTQQQPKL